MTFEQYWASFWKPSENGALYLEAAFKEVAQKAWYAALAQINFVDENNL